MTSTNDPITMDTELPYEGSATDFRLHIAKQATAAQHRYSDLVNTGQELSRAERAARMDALHASSFGWSLVAVIGWLRKEYGEETAWRATAMAQDVMTNGGNSFCEDVPFESGALALVDPEDGTAHA